MHKKVALVFAALVLSPAVLYLCWLAGYLIGIDRSR